MIETVSTDIVIGQRRIPYRLVRSASSRKLKLTMTMDEFRVTAPSKMSEAEIKKALSQKHKWIVESHAALQDKYEQTHKIARFRSGAKLPYWGRLSQLRTQLSDVSAPAVVFKNQFHIQHPNYATCAQHDEAVESALHSFLKHRFSVEAQSLARTFGERLGVGAKSLRITEMSKRWGSCTDTGNITLDWRLVYAPKRVVAYVVAHELAHLKINNHSKRFWNLLNTVYGAHEQEHNWLAKNEHLLGYKKLILNE